MPAIDDIMAGMHPEGAEEEAAPAGDEGLQSCADDMMSAIESKDAMALASALKAAFEYLESQPHEEAGEVEGE